MARLWLLVLLASCWRDGAPAHEPASFVARINARAALHRQIVSFDRRLSLIVEHIAVLRNETERQAIAADLAALDRTLARLRDQELTDDLQRELARIHTELERVREELALATSADERAAREQLGKHPADTPVRLFFVNRRLDTLRRDEQP